MEIGCTYILSHSNWQGVRIRRVRGVREVLLEFPKLIMTHRRSMSEVQGRKKEPIR